MYYEKTYPKASQLKLFDCQKFNWQEIDRKFEVTAKFNNKDKNKIETGIFILIITHFPNPKVVTVMRNDIENEFFLSSLIRSRREAGKLTPEDLLELHPRYERGEVNTFDDLAKAFFEKERGSTNRYEYQEEIERIRLKTSEELEHLKLELEMVREKLSETESKLERKEADLEDSENENEKLKTENQNLANELGIKLEELEAYKKEKNRAEQNNDLLDLNSNNLKLIDVATDVMHRGSICTILKLSDGSERFMKISTFDRDLSVTNKAKTLIGKFVKISCWDPVYAPRKWSSQGYFRNVYEASIE